MKSYEIYGGRPLTGTVSISGNKNAALPCIAATLLTDDEIQLGNIPDIADVNVMLRLVRDLGSAVISDGSGRYRFRSAISYKDLDASLVDSVRGSILFAGPLLARGENILLPPPGGDVIGLRRLDTHFIGLSALGVSCSVERNGYISLKAPSRLKGADIFFDEASVTATENVIMAAVLAEGRSTIYNAACEPHIQDLCKLLNLMGADIEGIGSNYLTINGRDSLHGASYQISADYMECGSFIGLAAATGGDLRLTNVRGFSLRPLELGFAKLGIRFSMDGDTVHIPSEQDRVISKTYSGVTSKLDDAPWPGFPADLLSIMTVTACRMKGSILIHEKMFESRMYFIDYLIRMGADIILCDPHRAVVNGPSGFNTAVVSSPDVRAGMALVIAALCTEGRTVIENIGQIERGYENLQQKLLSIGAEITVC